MVQEEVRHVLAAANSVTMFSEHSDKKNVENLDYSYIAPRRRQSPTCSVDLSNSGDEMLKSQYTIFGSSTFDLSSHQILRLGPS
jgi:hypothetical protein